MDPQLLETRIVEGIDKYPQVSLDESTPQLLETRIVKGIDKYPQVSMDESNKQLESIFPLAKLRFSRLNHGRRKTHMVSPSTL